jgi:hypothetical protein
VVVATVVVEEERQVSAVQPSTNEQIVVDGEGETLSIYTSPLQSAGLMHKPSGCRPRVSLNT